jgi:hypothetical protein
MNIAAIWTNLSVVLVCIFIVRGPGKLQFLEARRVYGPGPHFRVH